MFTCPSCIFLEWCSSDAEQPCLEYSNEETDVADGQVPVFQLAEWETENYTRPDFTVVKVVEQLHGWFRFLGSNDFDLESHHYGKYVLSSGCFLVGERDGAFF